MKNLFDEFQGFLPRARTEALRQILQNFNALHLPADKDLISQVPKDRTIIVVDEVYPEFNPVDFFMAGFEHVLYSKREDFVSELLSSCWMTLRPGSFADNPIPFFFNGFVPESFHPVVENNFLKKISHSQEKPFILNELDYFLSQYTGLTDIKDICLQSADEMLMNALYMAPVTQTGKRLYEKTPKDVPVQLLEGYNINFFACFSPTKVIIGCEDPFGSVDLERVLERVKEVYPKNKTGSLDSKVGSGIGLNFMMTNSSNFYMYCQQKKKTVVACGFLLQGKRKNTSANKHIHISIR